MKTVSLSFKDDSGKTVKTFKIGSIKTGIMDRVWELADEAKNYTGIKGIREWDGMLKVLLVDVFKGQFTFDELQGGAEDSDIKGCFNDIMRAGNEEVTKN
jgi:hypothetical protein